MESRTDACHVLGLRLSVNIVGILTAGRVCRTNLVELFLGISIAVAAEAVTEKWQVCNQLGGPRASAIAQSERAQHMRFVPWAGVAARLSTSSGKGGDEDEVSPVRGAAYCFLPLPVNTGLPVHVNGYFELSSNR